MTHGSSEPQSHPAWRLILAAAWVACSAGLLIACGGGDLEDRRACTVDQQPKPDEFCR